MYKASNFEWWKIMVCDFRFILGSNRSKHKSGSRTDGTSAIVLPFSNPTRKSSSKSDYMIDTWNHQWKCLAYLKIPNNVCSGSVGEGHHSSCVAENACSLFTEEPVRALPDPILFIIVDVMSKVTFSLDDNLLLRVAGQYFSLIIFLFAFIYIMTIKILFYYSRHDTFHMIHGSLKRG